jgi:hypothetical protein
MKKRLWLAVLCGALTVGASATASTTNDTVSGEMDGPVGSMGTTNATYSEVFLIDSSTGNNMSCAGFDSRIFIARAHARHQLMFDTLLAAKLSGRRVAVAYEVISSQCWIKQVHIK